VTRAVSAAAAPVAGHVVDVLALTLAARPLDHDHAYGHSRAGNFYRGMALGRVCADHDTTADTMSRPRWCKMRSIAHLPRTHEKE
jgi:hypothetical protein